MVRKYTGKKYIRRNTLKSKNLKKFSKKTLKRKTLKKKLKKTLKNRRLGGAAAEEKKRKAKVRQGLLDRQRERIEGRAAEREAVIAMILDERVDANAAQMRAELEGMKLSALKKRAGLEGMKLSAQKLEELEGMKLSAPKKLEEADDADDIKAAEEAMAAAEEREADKAYKLAAAEIWRNQQAKQEERRKYLAPLGSSVERAGDELDRTEQSPPRSISAVAVAKSMERKKLLDRVGWKKWEEILKKQGEEGVDALIEWRVAPEGIGLEQ